MLALKHKYPALNIKSNSNKGLQLSIAIGLMAFIASAHLIVRTSYNGLLYDVDTVDYLSTAENLTSGKGLRNYSYHDLIYWPLLYPILLALLNTLGIGILDASKVVNIAALGSIILLTGNWLNIHVKSRLIVVGTVAIIMASHVMNTVSLFATSETLFTLLTLLALLQIDKFLNQGNSMRVLSLSAVFAVLASLTRWVGISVILTTVLFIIVDQRISIKRRVRYTIFYGTLTIPFWVYIASILGALGNSPRIPEMNFFYYLISVVRFFYNGWLFVPELGNIHTINISFYINSLVPEASFYDKMVIFSGITVIGIMLITIISNRNPNTYKRKLLTKVVQYRSQTSARLFVLLTTYTLIYLLTLYSGLTHHTYSIKYRFFFPIYIPILMCLILIFERFFWPNFGNMRSKLFKFVLVAIIAFGCVAHISRITQWNIDLTAKTLEYRNYNPYIQSYTPNSPIVEYLNNNRLEGDIFVNYVDILYRLTDAMPPVRPINCSKQFDQFTNSIPPHKEGALSPTYIILLTKVSNYKNCSIQESTLQNSRLELIAKTSDGLIYKLH